ncbi:class I tRNA ligase family protein [Micromonospora sp. HNM0581]|nr:class I tRNA ligase family protein [Micromonospora sp. HNM0581]
MSAIHDAGVGSSWGRIRPGGHTNPDRHDETEVLVFLGGTGRLLVDGVHHDVGRGTVAVLEPFDSHVIENTGQEDLVFFDLYWRDPARALQAAASAPRRGFGDRPVFVFSTPPTPNGDLHLGHLSGPYLGADVFVRFQRMNGTQAWHLTGSDDFQSYVVDRARRDGVDPATTAAHYSAEISQTLRLMDIELDQYTVTQRDDGYRSGLQDFFSRVLASGQAAARPGPALFGADDGGYLYEVDVSGECPTCSSGTGGNICEECGEPNFCADLIGPKSNRSGLAPLVGEQIRYSLPLHDFRADIEAHHRHGRVPARLRQLAGRLFDRPSCDVPITHPSRWGVPPVEDGVTDQVIWVWPEMSYGFLYGIEALGRRLGRDWQAARPQDGWKIVHFFGYDNSFYHAILYPALYRLAFPGWQPDIDYHVNEFYLLEGKKFSTSRRHAIWGKEILSEDTVDAVRFYLSLTRSEGRRTNFERAVYEATVQDTLIGRWQRWLTDLGTRVRQRYGGLAPDAGTWTPEHTAFLRRLGTRLAEVTGSLSEDAFSLNQAAAALNGIVEDSIRFAEQEQRLAELDVAAGNVRTAVALELAAASLLAHCAAPVLPRFAGNLAAALGADPPKVWPDLVTLLPPGSRVALADTIFFTAGGEPLLDGDPLLLDWLTTAARTAMLLPSDAPVSDRSLLDLGMSSMQAVALQYQILERTNADISIEQIFGARDLADLATLIGTLAEATPEAPEPEEARA